jgi:hypothetical protein
MGLTMAPQWWWIDLGKRDKRFERTGFVGLSFFRQDFENGQDKS